MHTLDLTNYPSHQLGRRQVDKILSNTQPDVDEIHVRYPDSSWFPRSTNDVLSPDPRRI
jgi:hypothetical protein